ncbi:MAG: zinc ABC transporter substrate-binding protein [Candidatus Puniceispirillaceae bacterium]|jgi:zinc transport system substrate-binding protein|nr:zinc ABC transporter substrate-binding protein [Alphaproteobacteria bacterium]
MMVRGSINHLISFFRFCGLGLLLIGVHSTAMASQRPLSVVASIKPIYSLVAAVMGDIGTPELLLKAPSSAHHFTLKPSQARILQAADIVFWVGPTMEQPLTKALATLAPHAQTTPLINASGLMLLEFNNDAPAHQKPGLEQRDDHDRHEKHGDHDGHMINPHIWLDPQNAQVMLREISSRLGKADPENAKIYAANADQMSVRLAGLQADIARQLAPYSAARFLVLHDAHSYFERRFGLRNHGAITSEPDVMPTASRIKALRSELGTHQIDCIFAEPLLGQKAVDLIAEGSKVRIGRLDPVASNLPAGVELYPDLLQSYATAMQACFSGN